MPATAYFSADFSRWNESLRNAQANLKNFEVPVKGVSQQLQRMTNSFSGVEIKRQAALATAAVESMGGAARLTTTEQKKLTGTVTEALAKYKALGEQAPESLHKIAAELKQLEAASANALPKVAADTKQLDTASASSATSIKSMVLAYAGGLATFQGVQAAIMGIGHFLTSSLESYASAEKATARLTQALKNQGDSSDAVVSGMSDLATQYQRTTRFSDDLITETQALFVQIGQVGPESMDLALTAATDLAEGLGVDLESAATAVAKALQGNDTALKKMAPSLDAAALKGGDLATVAAEIEKHFGGQAAAQLDTYSGRLEQIANDWDNVKEAIGKAIANDAIFRTVLRGITEATQGAEGATNGATGATEKLSLAQKASAIAVGNNKVAIGFMISALDLYAKALTAAADAQAKLAKDSALMEAANKAAISARALPKLDFGDALEEWEKQNKAIDKNREAIQKLREEDKKWRDQVTGREVERALAELARRWETLAASERADPVIQGHVAKQYQDLAQQVGKVPEKLRAFAVTMNEAAERTRLMALNLNELKPIWESLGPTADKTGRAFRDWFAEVGFEAQAPLIPFYKSLGEVISRLPESMKPVTKATNDWRSALDDVSRAFADLAQISGGALGKTLTLMGQVVSAANLAAKSAKSIGDGMEELDKGEGLKSNITGIAELTTGILGAAAAAIELGKALWDAFTNSRAEQTAAKIGREFGVVVSEAFAQSIEDQTAEFGGDRVAAQLANLDRIIAEGGGLKISNLEKLTAQLHNVFSMVETGALTGYEAMQVLDKNFKSFVDFLGGNVTPALKEIIRLNDQFGTQSKVIAEYVDSEARKGLAGIGGFIKSRGEIVTTLAEAQKKLAELKASSGAKPADIAAASAEVDKLQAKLAALPLSASGAEAFGASLFGIFERLTKDGASALEVFKEMDPQIASLDKQLQAAGLTGGAAFDRLKSMAALAKDEIAGPALEAIDSLTSGLRGLNNADILDPEMFKGITGEISDIVAGLLKQGKTMDEITPFIAKDLQTIWELQQDNGFAVDDTTQALIDQGVEAGKVGDKHRSAAEQALKLQERETLALEGIARLFGVTLPGDVDKFGQAIGRLPDDVTIPAKFDIPPFPDLPDPPQVHIPTKYDAPTGYTPGQGGTYPSGPNRQYHEGGPVYAASGLYIPRGSDTVPAMLTPGEFVMNKPAVDRIGTTTLSAMNHGQALVGNVTVNVSIQAIDGPSVERVVQSPAFAQAFGNAVRRNQHGRLSDLKSALK